MTFTYFRMSVARTALLVTALCISHESANALEIKWHPKDLYVLTLSGDIQAGDAEKFVAALLAPPRERVDKGLPNLIELNSRGGQVQEAAKIAQLIELTFANVKVPTRGKCASSCFLLYLAGAERWASSQATADTSAQSAFGTVGLHRPIIPSQTQGPSELHQLASDQRTLMSAMRKYLTDQAVPQYLIDLMMERPSNDIYWLTDEDLDRLGSYRPSIEELLISRCGYRRELIDQWYLAAEQRNPKRFAELDAQVHAIELCWIKRVSGPYVEEEGPKIIKKLRAGWRPWSPVAPSR